MSKGNGVFSNLRRSTKITLVSCGCFIALTALILLFFVMFPITPSEKVISSFGRESIYKQDVTGTAVTTAVTTTVNDDIMVAKGSKTTTASRTTAKSYTTHKLTSGSGFYMDQRIPTGEFPNQYYVPTTTTASEGGYAGEGQGTGSGQGGYQGEGGLGGLQGGTGTEIPGGGTEIPGGGTEIPGGGTGEEPAPVEGGGTPAPVEGGGTPAPVEGGGAAAAPQVE
ncbi:hypothetical protein [Ruminococcus flavefaciens]|uniref:Uncharacterized protein n=1 Tax=Ruminococcus flavefaciens TaxID=1265 RepID=A0A315Y3P3_RUMFL|nr:hypothetical protein [Ruminococcus flavefaciens]PWJ14178.1 hypothetical protein IE37_01113 [Ruminococcus flavefaciens]SSA43907.1 hypothetical protein SAMN02910325_01113 [Ruminococcus flavefaciens]